MAFVGCRKFLLSVVNSKLSPNCVWQAGKKPEKWTLLDPHALVLITRSEKINTHQDHEVKKVGSRSFWLAPLFTLKKRKINNVFRFGLGANRLGGLNDL